MIGKQGPLDGRSRNERDAGQVKSGPGQVHGDRGGGLLSKVRGRQSLA